MPSHTNEEFDRSLMFGEKAFTALTLDSIPVLPDMYEVLYAYESGADQNVVSALNDLSASDQPLTLASLQEVHDEHLSCDRMARLTDEISGKIGDEIRVMMEAVSAAGVRSEQCDAALNQVQTRFASIKTPDQLHSVVQALTDVTKAVAANNNYLSQQLDQSSQQIGMMHEDLQQARDESNTDALTGLANRKKFDVSISRMLAEFEETGQPLCLLMLDIDHFKGFNDNYGHQTGDQILRLVSQTLRHGLKGRDMAARYGGEEFAVLLSNITLENAWNVAEQIRTAIAAKQLRKRSTGEVYGRLTISIGITQALPGDTPSALIKQADEALYEAKNSGRNRCCVSVSEAA